MTRPKINVRQLADPALWRLGLVLLVASAWPWPVDPALGHHILGRPAYDLDADSNTPPSMNGEAQIGAYIVTYMLFPAFPEPQKPGRISFYAARIDDGTPFQGQVTFTVRDDSWLSWLGLGMDGPERTLGVQSPDDNIFRQRFRFHDAGDYIVTVAFEAGGEPYIIDFPVRIGEPMPVGPIGAGIGLLLIAGLAVSLIQRRRAATAKIRSALSRPRET
ncbi:MAG: hypothetical protein QF926_05065 [Alphaproteobacteria bacterium]|nr:hypothetical protein [Alphaproteobacteria bacterium]MDP6515981.1 hypothetical protein [Alphaproteobacteria bacterium]